VVLAISGDPEGLVVGDDRVCWTDPAAGAVECVAKAGGAPWFIGSGMASPSGISIARGDAPASWGPWAHDTVYWTEPAFGRVYAAQPGVPSPYTLAANLDHPRAVAAVAGEVYAKNVLYVSTDGPLLAMEMTVGETQVLADGVGQAGSQGLATDGARVYAAPSLEIVPIDGSPALILTYAEAVRGVACDASSVYFTAGDGVFAASHDGSTRSVLAQGKGTGEGVAVDATHVYWVTPGTAEHGFADGAVWRVPIAGGAATAVATAQVHPIAVGVDDGAVYWTASGTPEAGGAVMKLEKSLLGE
jgi:hypothetical protein